MSEQRQQQSQENESQEQEQESQEPDVQGVDTDPDDGKKSIKVDTDERLEGRDDEEDFDEIPVEELEKERDERLAPENRPETAEVDNSQRTFNPETGLFEDSDVDPPEGAPFATTEAETSNSGSGDDDDDDDKESGDLDPMDAADEGSADRKDRTEATDAEQSKEAKESKDTEG